MKLSLYTAVKDGILNDLHVEAMLRHHVPLADEIVVNEGYSKDDTYERITNIHPKIKVFRTRWEIPKNVQWCLGFKDAARRRCTGDWCIHLDCDEFIPEWEFGEIRRYLESTSDVMIPVRFVNFYGNYRVFHAAPEKVHWPAQKMIIHRNWPEIEFWGDGSNIRLRGQELTWDTSSQMFTVHHFGMVREAATLRYKWWLQGRALAGHSTRLKLPKWLFRRFPHDWMEPQFFSDLALYEGPAILAVREDPQEFTRDDMQLVRALQPLVQFSSYPSSAS
jgi:glycosyltransferase involved in cell wall biosynthesis